MQTMQGKNKIIIISAVVLIALLAVYLVFDKKSRSGSTATVGTSTVSSISSSTATTNAAQSTGSLQQGQYTIERVDINNNVTTPLPNLSRQVVFGANVTLTAEQKSTVTAKIQDLQSQLKKNTNDLLLWIQLGNYYKMAGDYQGAIAVWKYEADISNDFIGYGNIGDVYAYYLHDNGLAETYYRKAIERAPTKPTVYIQLAEMYRDVFQDKDKETAVINEGLSKIPNNPALLEFKSNIK